MKVLLFLFVQTAAILPAMNYDRIRCTAENATLNFSYAAGPKGAVLSYVDGPLNLLVKADHMRFGLHKDIGMTVTAVVMYADFDGLNIFFDASMAGSSGTARTLLRFTNAGKVVSSKLLDCAPYKD